MGLKRTPEQLIKAGLSALKQKDYGRAISLFEQLNQADDISASHRLKAQMGLVRTYEAQGAIEQAQNLCKPLIKSRSQAVRQWAHDKLQQLVSESENSLTADTLNISQTSENPPELSGFIPFNSNESLSKQDVFLNQDVSSIDLKEPLVEAPADPPSSYEEPITETVPGNKPDSINSLKADSVGETSFGEPSLFHYETLNNKRQFGINNSADSPESNNHSATTSAIPSNSADSPESNNHPTTTSAVPSNSLEDSKEAAKPQRQPSLSSKPPVPSGPETWPQGTRLKSLKSLGKVNMGPLWLAQLITIPILFFVVRWLLETALRFTGDYLRFVNRLLPISIRVSSFFWQSQTWTLLLGLGILILASPWLWPLLLRPSTQLTGQQLQTYSPEADQLVRRLCAKRRWPLPRLQLLASELPLIFSYGWRPRYGQLAVSQGCLDCLTADELAAIIMYEMSHWPTLDWIAMSAHGLLLQGCHRAYWFLARWGMNRPIVIKIGAGVLANLSYVIFWVLVKLGCGLSRTRVRYCDRIATELTGNPNALVRALAKLSKAMAAAVAQQGYTPELLESLQLMLPVGPEDLGGSAQAYAWGALNPLRHWLSINQAHPPLGERLYTLGAYGRHWRLKPSLNFAQLRLKNSSRPFSFDDWQDLLMQGGGWAGLVVGLGIAVIMWLIGAISTSLEFPFLAWLDQDRSILIGIPLICAGTGQLLRINPFFPEIGDVRPINEKQFAIWQTDSKLIPLSSRPINISGVLTGRPTLANWLGQEWRLSTLQTSIKLHYASYFGPLSNVTGLTPWLQQTVTCTGWFRRGHHVWIDIDRIRTQQNYTKLAQHPIWGSIISILPLGYGLWFIFKGGA